MKALTRILALTGIVGASLLPFGCTQEGDNITMSTDSRRDSRNHEGVTNYRPRIACFRANARNISSGEKDVYHVKPSERVGIGILATDRDQEDKIELRYYTTGGKLLENKVDANTRDEYLCLECRFDDNTRTYLHDTKHWIAPSDPGRYKITARVFNLDVEEMRINVADQLPGDTRTITIVVGNSYNE